MSRKKKSRKPGIAPISANTEDRKKAKEPSEKRVKKKHGKAPGNRQKEAAPKKDQQAQSTQVKDPRLGSKKPILLTKAQPINAKPVEQKKPKPSPIAAIRKVDSSNADKEELLAIESDPQILAILEKQEEDIALTESEIDYFNEKMDRHHILREKLGISDDDEEDEHTENKQSKRSATDEDALWDKLDNTDFSDFE